MKFPSAARIALLFTIIALCSLLTKASDWGYAEFSHDTAVTGSNSNVETNRNAQVDRHVRTHMMPGGLSDTKPADMEINVLCGTLHASILNTLSSTTSLSSDRLSASSVTITPVAYRTQVVAGLNYFVKIRIDLGPPSETYYAVVRIFRPLPKQGGPNVVDARLVDADSPIEYI